MRVLRGRVQFGNGLVTTCTQGLPILYCNTLANCHLQGADSKGTTESSRRNSALFGYSRRDLIAVTFRTRRGAGSNSASLLDEIEASDSPACTCGLLPLLFGREYADFDNMGRVGTDGFVSSFQFKIGTNCGALSTVLAVSAFLEMRVAVAVVVPNLPGAGSCLPADVSVFLNISEADKEAERCQHFGRSVAVCLKTEEEVKSHTLESKLWMGVWM